MALADVSLWHLNSRLGKHGPRAYLHRGLQPPGVGGVGDGPGGEEGVVPGGGGGGQDDGALQPLLPLLLALPLQLRHPSLKVSKLLLVHLVLHKLLGELELLPHDGDLPDEGAGYLHQPGDGHAGVAAGVAHVQGEHRGVEALEGDTLAVVDALLLGGGVVLAGRRGEGPRLKVALRGLPGVAEQLGELGAQGVRHGGS